ncbi:zinc finger CW-type PWWP domain protein 2-like [Lingula anatina]|uniref:Zinc finger CW-type PWWP domain protein 2-like n=1 Tax=Lingula anatina TaxID=7574 RepID=A0A1S3IQN9_LINAN|nr:zinc finger CW-type PWWP domain protein 2-like [Lingula anatina]|eukprot:XP_013399859.1 zinc finger CW-type PWWP domain protein 2-like [Lingula anatina]
MNNDKEHGTCDAPEEDHEEADRVADECGYRFVIWPGVVSADPEGGDHVVLDSDGEPYWYHIEFLGNPHSHGWVLSRGVELYGHVDRISGTAGTCHVQGPKRKKRCKGLKLTYQPRPVSRNKYMKHDVQDAVVEADQLVKHSLQERLRLCQFVDKPKAQEKTTSG